MLRDKFVNEIENYVKVMYLIRDTSYGLYCALGGNGGIQSERRSTPWIHTKPFPIRCSNGHDHGGSTKRTTLDHDVCG